MRTEAHTVVVGSGPSGCALAGRLADAGVDVLLLEAGPDLGPRESGRWPADLLDASALTDTFDWGYTSEDTYPDRTVPFQRARVLGGCSSHNGCAAIRGSRLDYDAWDQPGWATDDLTAFFEEAERRLRVYRYPASEYTPFHAACLEAGAAIGIPVTDDLNDLDEGVAIGIAPVNIVDGVRFNAAFAFLADALRASAITIRGDSLVARVRLAGGRATGVELASGEFIGAQRVVIAGGTYESPAILQRSGVGPPDVLAAAGVDLVHALEGVGENLHDHPAFVVGFEGSERLIAAHATRDVWTPEEQSIAKLASDRCAADAFDLHLYPLGGPHPTNAANWRWELPVACLTPSSRGYVRIRTADPAVLPVIDHRYLADPEGHDVAVLADGVRLAREIAGAEPLARQLGSELGSAVTGSELEAEIRRGVVHYYHPVGTCAMGSVVDADGAVLGLEGLHVADCSIMPVIPRANTNVPAAVVGLRVAAALLA